MEKFDYTKAVEELEAIAVRVEDPKTSLEEIDSCLKRSRELITQCREYLRLSKESIDNQEN